MKLSDYLEKAHKGNKAEFARSLGRKPQHVSKMFRNPDQWFVVEEGGAMLVVQIRAVVL